MAKNTGLFQFTGKLGGLSGRQTVDGNIIQTPGGFKGDRVKTEPRYEKTRQLYTEFGRCATISSLFKRTLDFYLRLFPDPYVYNHIQKRMAAIKECDTASPKGEKTVEKGLATAKGYDLLRHFSFNRKYALGGAGMPELSHDLTSNSFVLEGVDTRRFAFPKGARTLGMQLLLLRVDFNAATCIMTQSELVFTTRDAAGGAVSLAAPVPEGDGVVVGILFVGYCEVVNGEVIWKRIEKNVLEVVGVRN